MVPLTKKYPFSTVITGYSSVPCIAYKRGLGVIIACGKDKFHWVYHVSKIFEEATEKPQYPSEFVDDDGIKRTFLSSPELEEGKPQPDVQEFSIQCEQAPSGTHTYHCVVDSAGCHLGVPLAFGQSVTKALSPRVRLLSQVVVAVAAIAVAWYFNPWK